MALKGRETQFLALMISTLLKSFLFVHANLPVCCQSRVVVGVVARSGRQCGAGPGRHVSRTSGRRVALEETEKNRINF